MLKVIDIHTYYGDSHVLQGISLDLGQGSVVGILGRNGMGKTTLINSIIGSLVPESELDMIYMSVNTQFSVIGIKTSVLPESCGEVLIVTCACVGVVALAGFENVHSNVIPRLLTMIHHSLVCECHYMAFLVCILV